MSLDPEAFQERLERVLSAWKARNSAPSTHICQAMFKLIHNLEYSAPECGLHGSSFKFSSSCLGDSVLCGRRCSKGIQLITRMPAG